MSDLVEKCLVCHALVDEEDFFCANCGTEAPQRTEVAERLPTRLTHSFECRGCGASMSYDARAQTLRCPFCGSRELEDKAESAGIGPRKVVPFVIEQESARATLRQWLGTGFWRPSDLSSQAAVTSMAPVYVPYWIFEARTFTYWTADTSQTPAGARGDWYPLAGQHHGRYAGHLVGASGVLTPAETSRLCPFDLEQAKPPDSVDLDSFIVEQFRVQRKYARPLARRGMEESERRACEQYVPGRSRNLKVNVRLEGLSSEPVLLPVWIMAYRYQDKVYRFLLNGQTGASTGVAPKSIKKMLAVAAAVALIVVGIVVCSGLMSGAIGSSR